MADLTPAQWRNMAAIKRKSTFPVRRYWIGAVCVEVALSIACVNAVRPRRIEVPGSRVCSRLPLVPPRWMPITGGL